MALVVGGLLRFHNPAHPWLSHDEVFTLLRSAGYRAVELDTLKAQRGPVPAAALQTFLKLSPFHLWSDTLGALVNNPEHPPLYFLLARFVRERLNDSIAALRQLSGLFSLLVLPAIHQLSREVSARAGVAALAVAMVAVSPLQLLYAQDARPYSLLFLLTTLACCAYLRLRRRGDTASSWVYCFTLVSGLYTSLIFLVVLLSHGLHAWLPGSPPGHRTRWGIAMAGAATAFLPWLLVMAQGLGPILRHTAWLREPAGSLPAPLIRSLHWSSPFLDLGDSAPAWMPLLLLPVLVVLAWIGIIVLRRKGEPGGWSLLMLLLLCNGLAVALPDLLLGGRHSLVTRYLLPASLSVVLLVAAGLEALLHTQRLRLVGLTLLTLLVLGGTASCLKILSADTWWSRYSFDQKAIRDQLESQPDRVLRVVRSSSSSGEAVALSQKLMPETLLFFADAPLPPEHPAVLSSHQLGQVLIRSNQIGGKVDN
ncbi:MAG: glycosyltransferase family 39 protein [Cyanobium sp.]